MTMFVTANLFYTRVTTRSQPVRQQGSLGQRAGDAGHSRESETVEVVNWLVEQAGQKLALLQSFTENRTLQLRNVICQAAVGSPARFTPVQSMSMLRQPLTDFTLFATHQFKRVWRLIQVRRDQSFTVCKLNPNQFFDNKLLAAAPMREAFKVNDDHFVGNQEIQLLPNPSLPVSLCTIDSMFFTFAGD
jgi:hypothetical protein